VKLLILGLSLFSVTAMAADTTTLDVANMHCAACKQVLTTKVCDDAKLKTAFASCTVKWINKKKQLGQVVIVAKKDTVVDVEAVKAAIASADEDYVVTVKESK
jgi:hypothetical protein